MFCLLNEIYDFILNKTIESYEKKKMINEMYEEYKKQNSENKE